MVTVTSPTKVVVIHAKEDGPTEKVVVTITSPTEAVIIHVEEAVVAKETMVTLAPSSIVDIGLSEEAEAEQELESPMSTAPKERLHRHSSIIHYCHSNDSIDVPFKGELNLFLGEDDSQENPDQEDRQHKCKASQFLKEEKRALQESFRALNFM
ncbi:hypothetical protein POTOM_053519 [Populus tomentosa]|uniref:Uncharacterized protein n=1 Tax=Populus tomentosa TaxID=118781 RepID=A0A8X7XXJ7_POPTO|nr:hypothetical protein POTOM_053519 [Populus tomentosa]